MKKFMQETRIHHEGLNTGLIDRTGDQPLEEVLEDTWRSMEIIENLEFLDITFQKGEEEIDINDFIQRRAATDHLTQGGTQKFTFINDNRISQATVRFKATCLKIGGGEDEWEESIITKKILYLNPDENGYVQINGKKKYLIYQMVDASTYNTKTSVILRTMLSVAVVRAYNEIVDTNGHMYNAVTYSLSMFTKDRDILPFFFGTMGFYETLVYFGCEEIIDTVSSVDESDKKNIYFKISSKLYIKVTKELFDSIPFVKSMVAMILKVTTNRLNLDNIFDKHAWIERIGSYSAIKSAGYYDKGLTTIRFLRRMLDITHKKNLRVHDCNKTDIFAVLRWMMQNFTTLRQKDNLDLENKVLRHNTFVGALFTFILSDKINRAINIGKRRFTQDNVKEIFNFPGNTLISALSKSGLLVYDDRVNDLDVVSKLRYSIKGVNSLGNKNDRKITPKFRALHPSHLGRVDICCVGNSDTGTSGLLCPYVKTDGLSFSSKNEPEDAGYQLEKAVIEYMEKETQEAYGYFENEEEFYIERHEREIEMMADLTTHYDRLQEDIIRENQWDEEGELIED